MSDVNEDDLVYEAAEPTASQPYAHSVHVEIGTDAGKPDRLRLKNLSVRIGYESVGTLALDSGYHMSLAIKAQLHILRDLGIAGARIERSQPSQPEEVA